jgi:monovalent cation:H+ antiporter-2, CPA2 family
MESANISATGTASLASSFAQAFGGYYAALILFLLVAAVFVPIFVRFRVSTVLGFLLLGVCLGPAGLGRLATTIPLFGMFTHETPQAQNLTEIMNHIAEFGVVFLLFQIGLELTWERVKSMRKQVLGLGAAQMIICSLALMVVLMFAGLSIGGAAAAGMALALSSTAVVIPVLAERKKLNSASGRSIFAVLLSQDLAVAPVMITVAVLAGSGGAAGTSGPLALAAALLGMGLLVFVGRRVLRPLFNGVAMLKSRELFMAACLLVIFVSGRTAVMAGLSMGLGAFIAGVLLAETEYRREIEDMIEPFKGLLLGLFFVMVGARLDIDEIMAYPVFIIGLALGLIALKGIIVFAIARMNGLETRSALEVAGYLGPAGEFAFVIMDQAMGLKLIGADIGQAIILSAILSLFTVPLIAGVMEKIIDAVSRDQGLPPMSEAPELVSEEADVLIIGYGRVGALVAEMLQKHELTFAIVDANPKVAEKARGQGLEAWWGDATRMDFLNRVGLSRARSVVVTVSNVSFTDAVVKAVREARADVSIIARARDAGHAERLYDLGATDAVPETIEASLQLAENTLVDLGVPMGKVIASIHDKRDQFRQRFAVQVRDGGRRLTVRSRAVARPTQS